MFKIHALFVFVSLILLIPTFPLFAAFFCLIERDWSLKGYWGELGGLFGEIRYAFSLLRE